MIYVVGERKFVREMREFIKAKDYAVIDATDGTDIGFANKMKGVITKEALVPPSKVVKCKLEDYEWDVDEDKINKMWKKFIKSDGFRQTMYALLEGFLNKDMNVFIVISNNAYKAVGHKYAKAINLMLDSHIKFVYTYEDYLNDKSSLRRRLSDRDISRLKNIAEHDFKDDLEARWDEKSGKKKKHKKHHSYLDDEDEENTKNLGKFIKKLLEDDEIF